MPDWRAEIRARLAPAGLRAERERLIVEEFAQHLEDRYRDLIARGVSESDAVAAARREIDAARFDREIARAVIDPPASAAVGSPAPRDRLSGLWQDCRYAIRSLRRSPGFFLAATVTVAVSTGPLIATLGLANWLFLRPLPGVDVPERTALVWFGTWSDRGFSPSWVSYGHLDQLRARLRTIRELAGQHPSSVSLSLNDAVPRMATGRFVTANFFDLLGVRFEEGRGFRPDEDRDPGGGSVVVVAASLARSLFPDRSPIGQTVRVNGHPFEIVGVTERDFRGTALGEPADLWLPARSTPRVNHAPPERWAFEGDRGPFYQLIARLSPGATFEEADAELRVATRMLADRPGLGAEKYRTVQPTLFPRIGLEPFARETGWNLTRLLLSVGALLVVLAAANLANLFLFRVIARQREVAVRRALGASGVRLARLQLLEGVVVSGVGGSVGLLLVFALKAWLAGMNIPGLTRVDIAIDGRLLAMVIAIAFALGGLLGLAPARLAARADLVGAIGSGTRTGTRPTARLRTSMAVVQTALSLMLFVGALLFIHTIRHLKSVDFGIDVRPVSTFMFASREQGYTPARALHFYRDLLEQMKTVSGIDAVSASGALPVLGFAFFTRVLSPADAARTVGRPAREGWQAAMMVRRNDVTPDYFGTLGMHLVAGRTFTDSEAYTSGPEAGVVISASLAERLYGSTNAVGRLMTFPAQGGDPRHDVHVIGVVNDVRASPTGPIEPILYGPFAGSAVFPGGQVLAVRSSLPPAEVVRLVKDRVSKLDSELPISRDRTLNAMLEERLMQQRVNAWALGVLAGLGFVLAAVGIHGLVAQIVADRLREFGIRLALGATRRQIVRLVLRGALLVIAIGVPVGLLLAGLGSQLVKNRLFGITPLDAAVYIAATLALGAIVIAASLGPARHASRVDPVTVLRVD